jgi:hypothetical protein
VVGGLECAFVMDQAKSLCVLEGRSFELREASGRRSKGGWTIPFKFSLENNKLGVKSNSLGRSAQRLFTFFTSTNKPCLDNLGLLSHLSSHRSRCLTSRSKVTWIKGWLERKCERHCVVYTIHMADFLWVLRRGDIIGGLII